MKRSFHSAPVLAATLLPAFALAQPQPRPCFTINVETKIWSADGAHSEEHRWQETYRGPRMGDLGIYRGQEGCNVSALAPGQSRRFFLLDLKGTAIGRQGSASGTSTQSGMTDRDTEVYVTITRKQKGATLKFSASSPLPADENCAECFGTTAILTFKPDVFELSEDEVNRLGAVSKTVKLTGAHDRQEFMGSGTATLNATKDLEDEMVLETEESFNSWLPTPAQKDMPGVRFSPSPKIRITARIQPKQAGEEARKDRIDFVLEEVTKHKGRCGNFPQSGSVKDDLRFADEQPDGIVVEGNSAHTKGKVTEATVYVEATDFGAWGRIRASARELSLKALHKTANTYSVTIPRDDDNNKIADVWERQMKSSGDANADQENVAGQDRRGDGLTFFDEYRGLVIQEGGEKVHKRLDPQSKEIFIIDPNAIFSTEIWLQASDVTAHRIDESMIAGGGDPEESRVINFNADGNKKYAIRVIAMPGAEDPADPGGTNPSMGYTECGECRMPKDADVCKVFPARIRAKIEELYRWLSVAARQPGSLESQELAGLGFPPWLANQALQTLQNPVAREALVRQMQTQIAIHEVGHAVSFKDHGHGSPKGAEDAVRECPMYYPKEITYQRFIILQTVFRGGASMPMRYTRFCRGLKSLQQDGYNCHARINVKDW